MLDFLLYDRTGQFRQTIVPKDVHVELLWNKVSFCELTFDDNDKAWTDLADDGARVEILVAGDLELAGTVTARSGTGPVGDGKIKVEDDFRLFRNLGWPNPADPIDAQTSEYRRYTGPTETVVKAACAELSARLGLGWTIPGTGGLGADRRVEFRFHPLVDLLVPFLEADGLTWTIRNGVVDVDEGALFPTVLTPQTGVLASYAWSATAPTATRVVVGGEGEGAARVLQQFVDTPRETTWGQPAEVFKDSRMAEGVTDLAPDGAEALAEGAPKVSVTADLIENGWFRYGAYRVGDRVHLKVGGIDATEVITQVVIDDTAAAGLVVTPHIGAIEDDGDSVLAEQVARLSRAIRDQRSMR